MISENQLADTDISDEIKPLTKPIKESHTRSILKGFTWRILATTTTISIAYIITGQIGNALKIGAIEFVGKLLIYYMHERAWQLVPRGTIRKLFTRA